MGDRANICIVQHPRKNKVGTVYLYTHWGGDTLPQRLQNALQRGKERWDDEPYLGRILFCGMLPSEERWADLAGYGITSYITDNEHNILVVDCTTKTVGLATEKACLAAEEGGGAPETFKLWTFEEYTNLSQEALQSIWERD